MGQAASKITEAATKAAQRASAGAASSAPPRASQAGASLRAGQRPTQPSRSAAQEEWIRAANERALRAPAGRQVFNDQNEYEIAQATSAEVHARKEMGLEPEGVPELPPDLIKFLNDAGPLKRTVDKDQTSPKVYDALVKDERARDEQAKQANKRQRRRMPILAGHGGDGGVDDGSMVERTTNFSTRDRSMIGTEGLGVTREDIFHMIQKVNDLKVDSPAWKKAVGAEYEGISKNESKSKSFDQLKDKALFENSLRYIGVPTLMRDNEEDVIGVWPQKARDLKHSFGLTVAPEGSLEFIMLNEGGGAAKKS